ncbi:Probable diguanylate cyclase YfiN [Mycobacteroides abscessus subsp. bolletii]|nr:Probable diguanylate cyclase YfiN [Mycobacteroides abscessus subsp. bolletii]SKS03520.1 Probable diguanylate cyclase YfiN [Mycobacteroides abscessus subsp. abscessus]SHW59577.1 Probable diguanylate cyclase YfiN [Mycobacteroides abscessus subsp. bolletii]SHW87270.1 Probable diguanylate cyclase YfiN [Mycobacteroides abscessus subsp. bolletii]SHX39379.1 Probable diguanylate cyclase YfiN [Mycobacteroides abscessus subsp. bolletii]
MSHNWPVPSTRAARLRRRQTPDKVYRFVTSALRPRDLQHLKVTIGLLCMAILPLGTIVNMHQLGPQGAGRIVHQILVGISFVVGLCWILGPWPSRRWAIAFVIWADLSFAISAWMYAGPTVRLAPVLYMSTIGVFAAFLLGWHVLALHCAFAFAVLSSITLWNIHTGAATFHDQFLYNAPVFTTVVVLPGLIQAVIEGGRRSIRTTISAANHDPLTGLLNRRGMQAAFDYALSKRPNPTTVVVMVADVDRFKELNDAHGHEAGDRTLQAVADRLFANTHHEDIAARIGGDEFMAVAFVDNPDDIAEVTARLRSAPLGAHGPDASLSVGIAWASTDEMDFSFESLVRQADFKLYEVKRARAPRGSTA